MIRALLPGIGWLFSPVATALGLVLMVAAAWTTASNWEQFLSASEILFSPRNWLWMTVAWIALKVVHELAHAIACRRYGGEVREVGIAFMLFAPLAYVDVTSSWRWPSKWSRIHVSIAGIYVEVLVAAAAALIWQHAESKFAAHMLYNLIVMASVSTILFKANPLMRFDGYFILSDLLEIPYLYAEGSKTVHRQINRFLFGSSPKTEQIRCSRRWWVGCYGWASAVWRIVLCASLAIAASVLFHGAGFALTMLAVAGWVGKLQRVEPRATTRLIHPALSANEGGPLEVVPSAKRDAGHEDELELAEPCFRAVVSVPADCATTMFSGQRTNVMIGYRSESIGVTFYRTITDWIRKKTAIALSTS